MLRLLAIIGFLQLAFGFAGAKRTSEKSWRDRVLDQARGELGVSDPTLYYELALGYQPEAAEEWCGIFALAMLKRAGLALDWLWKISEGFLYRLPRAKTPQPGDLYYMAKGNHHGIVEQINRDSSGHISTVQTIDGNSVNGEVARNVRSPDEISAYYSITPLIQEAK